MQPISILSGNALLANINNQESWNAGLQQKEFWRIGTMLEFGSSCFGMLGLISPYSYLNVWFFAAGGTERLEKRLVGLVDDCNFIRY